MDVYVYAQQQEGSPDDNDNDDEEEDLFDNSEKQAMQPFKTQCSQLGFEPGINEKEKEEEEEVGVQAVDLQEQEYEPRGEGWNFIKKYPESSEKSQKSVVLSTRDVIDGCQEVEVVVVDSQGIVVGNEKKQPVDDGDNSVVLVSDVSNGSRESSDVRKELQEQEGGSKVAAGKKGDDDDHHHRCMSNRQRVSNKTTCPSQSS